MFTIEITLPSGETQKHTFQDTALSIGRMLGQVQLQDAGVSALHGQLTLDDGKVCYRDLGSAKGSYLPDGTPIRYTVAMQAGDRVKLGDHQLALIEFADPDRPAPPSKPENKPVVIEASSSAEPLAAPPHVRSRRRRATLGGAKRARSKAAQPEPSPPEPSPPESSPQASPPSSPAPTRSLLADAELSPTPIRFAGRERNAPRIIPSNWVDAATNSPPMAELSKAILRERLGPLLGSGPLLTGLLAAAFVLALALAPLSPAFFGLLFLVCFAVAAHTGVVWSLSMTDLLSDGNIRPVRSWKRVGKLPLPQRARLFLALALSAPTLVLPFFVLPVGLLEPLGLRATLKRAFSLSKLNARAVAGPLLLFAICATVGIASLIAVPIFLPGWMGAVLAAVSGLGAVLLATWSGMYAGLHVFRVYFWQCAQDNPHAPQLRPALLLPDGP